MQIIKKTSDHVVDFAAEELKKYLRMMMPRCGEIRISCEESGEGFRLGLMQDFGLDVSDAPDTRLDDIVYVDTEENGGIIAGSNMRSVLLAVYAYLRENGCRWLFPGIDGEYIPTKDVKPVHYRKKADVRYRGQCNEGAESQQCMMDTIDYAPKVGMNVYMMEFDIPKVYYSRYYDHVGNPAREPEPVSADTVLQWKRACEAEISKRGLEFHDMGHGWTAETIGVSSLNGWSKSDDPTVPEESKPFIAELNGKRELCKGVALNTQICMSNPEARRRFTKAVVDYAKISANVDVLHVWLADWQQNHCECEACRKRTPSDWYVTLLNEVDEALTRENLPTIIGGCAYSDTAWEPTEIRLKNPKRFVMNLGAITRSYRYSVEKDPVVENPTPYVRNVSSRLDTMEEYMMRIHRWMDMAPCDYFAYEYHFWKAQTYAPGVISFAKRLYEDVRSYLLNRFSGIVEDGSQRAFFPNGLNYYVYARTMFDLSVPFEDLVNDYFGTAYGEAAGIVRTYFEEMDGALRQDYIEAIHSKKIPKGKYKSETEQANLKRVGEICDKAEEALKPFRNMPKRIQTVSVRLLSYHMEYCRGIANALFLKAEGRDNEAKEAYEAFFAEFGKKEQAIERYYDQMVIRTAWNPIFASGIEQNM